MQTLLVLVFNKFILFRVIIFKKKQTCIAGTFHNMMTLQIRKRQTTPVHRKAFQNMTDQHPDT